MARIRVQRSILRGHTQIEVDYEPEAHLDRSVLSLMNSLQSLKDLRHRMSRLA